MSVLYSIQIRPQLQVNVKKLGKMPRICQKIILHPNYDTYECNFLHVYSFNIWVNDILYELGIKFKKNDRDVPTTYSTP